MSDPHDLPIFRPRIGRARGPASRSGLASFRQAVLSSVRRAATQARKAGGRAARSRVAVQGPGPDARRVIVKAHLVKMNASGAKASALHVRYIERDGVEKDGSKGVLYDASGPARADAFEQPRVGEKHQFRLIVSPEDAAELDLGDYIRRYMARVEKDLGRKLEWAAVNHFDTDHPHAHILIRGVDRAGQEVRLDRGYIANGLRWRAQELATEELGPRRERDLQTTYAKEISQERFTTLDRELARRAVEGRVDARTPSERSRPGAIDESTLVARLEHLERLRLAVRQGPASWSLCEGWQEHLREVGARGDILKQMHQALRGDPARYQILQAGQALPASVTEPGQQLHGRLVRKGLADELKGGFYAYVETPAGGGYRIPLDAKAAETLREGDMVSVTSRPERSSRPQDAQIVAQAQNQGGVYDLAEAKAASGEASGVRKRLRELQALQLAAPDGPDRWRIAADLPVKLQELDAASPKHRVVVQKDPLRLGEQVDRAGPVWLDRVDRASLAPYGLGADVRRALAERDANLVERGIDPSDPRRLAKLHELERRAVGEDMAAKLGQTFLGKTPEAFGGRLQIAETPTGGAPYAVVSDGGRLVVVPATRECRAAEGKKVHLSKDPKGRWVVRPTPDQERGL